MTLKAKTVKHRTNKLIQEIERIRDQIVAIRKQCGHEWEYEGDPSGNNDSGYFCRACGSWRRTKGEST